MRRVNTLTRNTIGNVELDRNLAVRRLADLIDLEREVIGPEPVRVASGRTLVDTRR